jgi:hypothetical protein
VSLSGVHACQSNDWFGAVYIPAGPPAFGRSATIDRAMPPMRAREGRLPGMRIGQVESSQRAYLLLWVAVLFVIFQTPLIRSRLWKSIQPLESSESKLS